MLAAFFSFGYATLKNPDHLSAQQSITEPTQLMTVGNTVGTLKNKTHTIHLTPHLSMPEAVYTVYCAL